MTSKNQNRTSRIAVYLLLVLFCVSCAQAKEEIAVVSVKWERALKVSKLNLYRVVDGGLTEVASSSSGADSMFYFACKPLPEGFYFIGVNPQAENRYAVYLKPGDRVNMTVTRDSYILTGNNSPENIELKKWHDFILPVERKSIYRTERSVFRDFFPLLTEKAAELANYTALRTGNKTFDRKFEAYRQIDFYFLAVSYFFTLRSEHPTAEDYPDFYRNQDLSDFVQTAMLLEYPNGLNLVDRLLYTKSMSTGVAFNDPHIFILDNMDDLIANDTLKAALTMRFAASRRTYFGLLDYMETYGKYLISEEQQNKLQDMLHALSEVKDGAPAIDFRFPDASGKQVALSDFKGKVVYIDVWATWCGPCKQELPHLKKIMEEFRNNRNIVFLSVSVDAQRDHEKWKQYIVAENLDGVQLFAGERAKRELMDPYKITGIPRFMIIGKDGALVSADAPRPSSPELKIALNGLLR